MEDKDHTLRFADTAVSDFASDIPHAAIPPGVPRIKSSFGSDVLRLVSGTGAGQIIGVLAAPLIARLFAPEAFGLVALFGSVSGVLTLMGCLSYEQPICLPKSDRQAANALALCLVLLMLCCAGTSLLVLLFGRWAVKWANAPELRTFVWLLPLNLFISGTVRALTFWNMRTRHFTRITAVQVVNRAVMTTGQVGLGLAGFVSGKVLIGSSMCGAFVGLLILAATTLHDSARLFLRSISASSMRWVLRRYRRFPKFALPATLLNSVSWQVPTVLLSGIFNPSVVGNYFQSARMIRLPANLLGTSFRTALFPRVAEAKHEGALAPSVERALHYLVLLSFFPCVLLTLCGKDLLVFAFGSKWHEAGVYTQLLSVWLFFWFISTPLNTVFAVLEQQALDLRFQAVNLATRLVSLAVGGWYGSPRVAIALFAGSGVVVYGAYCYAVLRKSKASVRRILPLVTWNLMASIPAAAVILMLHVRQVGPFSVLIAATLMLVVYYSVLVGADPAVRGMARQLTRRFSPAAHRP